VIRGGTASIKLDDHADAAALQRRSQVCAGDFELW
jgi:hypothetical protein